MRFLAIFSALLAGLSLCSCQQTYAGSPAARNGQARVTTLSSSRTPMSAVAHTPTPIPQAAQQVSGPNKASLVPTRPLATPATPAPHPGCAAVCVIDPRTGRVLYSHNGDTRRQVASTQKIITALCVCDARDLDKMVTIKASDNLAPPIRLNLKPGTSYRKRDLLRVMLTGSFNDVAVCLARDTAGNVENFAKLMNARARRMRMYNSLFVNPNGLPAAQYSTANDMALAACYAYNNPVIRSCINIPQYDFVKADGSIRTVRSTNKLLRTYPWVHGMKTGYTNAAGKCLISCGAKDGRAAIVVVLGSTNARVWGESLKYLKWALGIA